MKARRTGKSKKRRWLSKKAGVGREECERAGWALQRHEEERKVRRAEDEKSLKEKKSTQPTQRTPWPNLGAGKREEQRQRAVSWGGEEVRGQEKDRWGVQRMRLGRGTCLARPVSEEQRENVGSSRNKERRRLDYPLCPNVQHLFHQYRDERNPCFRCRRLKRKCCDILS